MATLSDCPVQWLKYGNPKTGQPKNRVKSGHRSFSPLTLLRQVEFDPAHTFSPRVPILGLIDFAPVVRMACERKFNESEATTGFFLLLGQQGNKAVLDWIMKEGLIPSRYSVRSVKRICVWLNERVRLMVLNGVVEYSRKRIPTLFAGVQEKVCGYGNPVL
ncbi:hypothetical protein TNCV_365391 [Trichonephila clavipes]|nr:hypothetical protein TNCV_365391 [Trichonephila clavipes]